MDMNAVDRATALFDEAGVAIDRPLTLMLPCTSPTADRLRISAVLRRGLSDPHPAVRYLAATELANVDPEVLQCETLKDLVSTLGLSLASQTVDGEAEYQEITDGASLEQDIALALARLEPKFLSPAIAATAVSLLTDYFRRNHQFYELGHAILGLTFARAETQGSPDSLTETQGTVLRVLLANSAIWQYDGDFPSLLMERGLPSNRNGVERMLDDAKV